MTKEISAVTSVQRRSLNAQSRFVGRDKLTCFQPESFCLCFAQRLRRIRSCYKFTRIQIDLKHLPHVATHNGRKLRTISHISGPIPSSFLPAHRASVFCSPTVLFDVQSLFARNSVVRVTNGKLQTRRTRRVKQRNSQK